MKIFHDWEFLEDGRTIEWISGALRAEDGRELYVINAELCSFQTDLHRRVSRHPWLMANVVKHLPTRAYMTREGETWILDPDAEGVMGTRQAALEVKDFILAYVAAGDVPELWAWFGAYDHVRLAQMFGPMISLPTGIPMVTHDICTLALLAGHGARRNQPEQTEGQHDALADARHNERLYDYYMKAALDRLEKRMA